MAYVNYDRKSKITVQKQSTDYNCAKTCLAMCLNVSINTVMNSFPGDYVSSWDAIAQAYGASGVLNKSPYNVQTIFNQLKAGNPVIVRVNSSNEHWVVVYKYEGTDTAITASNFTCADPWYGDTRSLTNALNYAGVSMCKVVN